MRWLGYSGIIIKKKKKTIKERKRKRKIIAVAGYRMDKRNVEKGAVLADGPHPVLNGSLMRAVKRPTVGASGMDIIRQFDG